MKQVPFGKTGLNVPAVAVGCMRFAGKTPEEMERFLHFAQAQGATFFDHADIYGGGKSEEVFGDALKNSSTLRREDFFLQSKCGIRKRYYDQSKEYILQAVDGILQRLQTEYLDCLLIHRPDALAQPEEIAEAFDILESTGKVKHFGVSNHNPGQMALLKKCVRHPANMQIVSGSTSEARLAEIISAGSVTLSRPEWYRLYLAAGHILP